MDTNVNETKENNVKGVLLTTMSTLRGMTPINYYYYGDKLCTGISGQESGSKYILSQYKVDKIFAICSDETLVREEEGNKEEEYIKDYICTEESFPYGNIKDKKAKGAYSLYLYRIAQFLHNENEDAVIARIMQNVSEKDKKKIEEIIDKCVEEGKIGFEETAEANDKEIVLKYKNIMEKINDKIEAESIENIPSEAAYPVEEEPVADKNKGLWKKICSFFSASPKREEKKPDVEMWQDYARYYFYKKYLSDDYKLIPKEDNDIESIKCEAVSDTENGYDNIAHIIQRIRAVCDDFEDVNIELYIDVQGGSRTQQFTNNIIMQILNNQGSDNINLKAVVATNFNPGDKTKTHEILDETARYRTINLAAGMNAFIQYGKADILKQYCEDNNMDKSDDDKVKKIYELVKKMKEVDDAISTCDVSGLGDTISALRVALAEVESIGEIADKEITDRNVINALQYFKLLSDGIHKDYGNLLTGSTVDTVDTVDLIDWCVKKDFIQQASTIVQSKMPKYIIDNFMYKKVTQNGIETDFDTVRDTEDFGKAVKETLKSGSEYDTPWEFVLFDKLRKGWIFKNKVKLDVFYGVGLRENFKTANVKYNIKMNSTKCGKLDDNTIEKIREKVRLSVKTNMDILEEKLLKIKKDAEEMSKEIDKIKEDAEEMSKEIDKIKGFYDISKSNCKDKLKSVAEILFNEYVKIVEQRNGLNHAGFGIKKKEVIEAHLECFIVAAKIYRGVLEEINESGKMN